MTRSGLQRVQQADSPPPESQSTSDDSYKAPSRQRTKKTTRTKKNRKGPPVTQQEEVEIQPTQTQTTRNRNRKRQRLDDQDEQDDQSDHDIATNNLQNDVPTLTNYQQLGLQWGISYAEDKLSELNVPKTNRLSPGGLFEAQCLQSQYHLHKTMLCITLKCSRKVLDEALLEGPLAREPNLYTNYQTYSVTATTTQMPGKGVSEGFAERNTTVGNTWTSYNQEERDVFLPRLFEPLCIATSEAYALTPNPLGIPEALQQEGTSTAAASTTVNSSRLIPLTNEEMEKYVPIFKRLVNLQKVSRDMHEGRLWRHSGKSRVQSMERLMMNEISKIAKQLHALKSHFNLHFHLLVACWNPTSPASRALFTEEHTSCDRWLRHQQKKHLLECFAFEATKAPEHIRPKRKEPKPPSESAVRQAQSRAELALALNNLIVPYLRHGYLGKGDAHPKIPDLAAAFERKTFRGDISLRFQRTPDSNITDMMLEKGTAALTNHEVTVWLDDIQAKRYTIIQVDKPKKALKRKSPSTPQETEAENASSNPADIANASSTPQETENAPTTTQEVESDTFYTPQ